MLTETQLRELLSRAGDTVAVRSAAAPVPAPPSRSGRSLAAAAAVAATLAVGVGTGWWVGRDGGALDTAPLGVLDGAPEGTVPSVFAQTRDSATELLEGLGLRVDYRKEVACEPAGRPVGTDPATGTPVEPGDTVTLLVAYQAANTDCMADLTEPWAFLDFATGRGPAPDFADRVRLFVDGKPAGTLTGAEATRGDWGAPSALTSLDDASGRVVHEEDGYRAPSLDPRWGTPPSAYCGVRRPAVLGDREALTLTVAFSDDTYAAGRPDCPARVVLYRTSGAIDAVVTWTERPASDASSAALIPDVVGMSLAEARAAVTGAGFTAQVEELETCDPRPGVVDQAPSAQDVEDDTADDPTAGGPVRLVVEVPHTTRDCAGLDAAAAAFLEFARGGPPPRWAPEVQQVLGYALRDQITAAEADDPDAWAFCSGVAPEECVLSPLAVASEGEVRTGESRVAYECELIDEGGLPPGLSSEDQIVLFPADPASCEEDWAVGLWIDGEGRIAAVNLLVPQSVADAG